MLSDILTKVAITIDSCGMQVPIYFVIATNICNNIITDVEWVWQMLLNMLTNASKYTEEGSIHVGISICNQYPPGRKVIELVEHPSTNTSSTSSSSEEIFTQQLLFQIVDTGVGVDPRKHSLLFEAFSQTQSGQSTGTGLGLFSVFNRSRKLGGACGAICPAIGEGCTFWFTIPYLPSSNTECVTTTDFTRYPPSHVGCPKCQPDGIIVMGIDSNCDKQHNHSSSLGASSSPAESCLVEEAVGGGTTENNICLSCTAFVVDDVRSIRNLLKRTLQSLGFTHVETFENGKRALDAMKREIVDIVIMDIQVIN